MFYRYIRGFHVIAYIPARAGSKRIPNKNVRNFMGKPLFLWATEAAVQSELFDKVIVSTDSPDILLQSWQYGFYFEYRDPALCTDHVQLDAVLRARALTSDEDICLVYCNPFIRVEDLIDGYKRFIAADYVHVTAMTPVLYPDLDLAHPSWEDAGQFSFGRNWAWRAGGREYGSDCGKIVVPSSRNVDINTPSDWESAERLFARLSSSDNHFPVPYIKDWTWDGARHIASSAESRD
jgi:N-acylneuraminate cytidylyltransferase